MNKILIIAISILVILIIGTLGWMVYRTNTQVAVLAPADTTQANASKGVLYFNFTDAAVNMGTISAITMTVDKVSVHSQSQGWITVSEVPQTFSLLALHQSGKTALMAKTDIKADTYDQIWFHMSAVMVTEKGKTAKQAILPSADFKMQGVVKVLANSGATVTLDVLAEESIHKTSKGEFIFAPVVTFEGRSRALVNVDSDNMITIVDGSVDSATNAGMDINGEVKANFKLDLNSNLQINGGVISVKTGL